MLSGEKKKGFLLLFSVRYGIVGVRATCFDRDVEKSIFRMRGRGCYFSRTIKIKENVWH